MSNAVYRILDWEDRWVAMVRKAGWYRDYYISKSTCPTEQDVRNELITACIIDHDSELMQMEELQEVLSQYEHIMRKKPLDI